MRDSDTYMAIIEEGREEGRAKQVKKDLLRLGQVRFGPADESTRARLTAIEDLDRLDRMIPRLLDASDWCVLLDTP